MKDPLGLMDGPNVYGYAKQGPIDARDPYGLEWEKSWSAIINCPTEARLLFFIGEYKRAYDRLRAAQMNLASAQSAKRSATLVAVGGVVLTVVTGLLFAPATPLVFGAAAAAGNFAAGVNWSSAGRAQDATESEVFDALWEVQKAGAARDACRRSYNIIKLISNNRQGTSARTYYIPFTASVKRKESVNCELD